MTRAASVVLAWLMLVFGADEWLVRKSMRDLHPPRVRAAVLRFGDLPDVPPPPPPPPVPLDEDVFP